MFRPLISHPKFQQTLNAFLALLVGFGLLYLIPKVVTLNPGPHDYFDFQPIWQAGNAWASGLNPYSPDSFADKGAVHPAISIWFYPPYWYPLVVPFGLMPFPIGLTVWKLLNFSLVFISTYLIARALADILNYKWLPLFLSGMVFVSFMYPTAVTAWSGQTSFLVYFGVSALVFGLMKNSRLFVTVGLVFLALKPQIGILAFAAVAGLDRYRWTIFPAGAICIAATLAIAITADCWASIEGFIANLPHHSEHAANSPPHLTGLFHVLYYLFPIPNASLLTLAVFLPASIGAMFSAYHSPLNESSAAGNNDSKIACLALFIAASFFIVPFHYYDMVALTVLPMMLLVVRFSGRWLIGCGLLLCYRPDFILRAVGSGPEEIFVSHLVSSGLVLILAGTFWSFIRPRSSLSPHLVATRVGQAPA